MGRSLSFLSRKRVGLFLVALLALNGAGWILVGRKLVRAAEGGPRPVRIEASLPTRGLEQADRLVIVFAEPVIEEAAAGELLPELEAAPFRLVPELTGSWSWESPTRLAFLPAAPLGPCRRVRMLPTAELERLAGRPVASGTEALYETAPLKLEEIRIAGSDSSGAILELEFNADVETSDLVHALRIVDLNDSRVSNRLLTRDVQRVHRLHVQRATRDVLFVSIHEGLVPARGERALRRADAVRLEVPTHFTIVGKSTDIHRQRLGGTIEVRFSTPLATGQESLPVSVTPSVADLTCRVNGRRLVLEGRFEPRTAYIVQVAASLLSAADEVLGEDMRMEVQMPRRYPSLSVSHGDGILSPSGHLSLSVFAGGVSKVRVTAHKVLPGNVVAHVRGSRSRHTSREILSELYPLPAAEPGSHPVQLHALDLAALLTKDGALPRGIHELNVADTSSRWTSDTATVRITDLAPTAKQDSEGVHVWVRALSTGESMVRARVRVMTITDQTLGAALTDESGYVFIEASGGDPAGAPYVVLVESGEGSEADLAYLKLTGQRWKVPSSVARGRRVPESVDVFLYPERNLYRPGDTVHLTAIARSSEGLVHQRPLRFLVSRPDGMLAQDETLSGDPAQGFVQFDFPTAVDARTGVWTVRAEDPETDVVVGRASFSLEAFLPARLELTANAELSTDGLEAGAAPRALSAVKARSLAGTQVDGFDAEISVRWSPRAPEFEHYPLFNFRAADDLRSVVRAEGQLKLDADGSVRVVLPGQDGLAPGVWEARAEWTVTEPGGRSSVAVSHVKTDTAGVHLGLRVDRTAGFDVFAEQHGDAGATVVAAGRTFQALGLALDRDGVPVPASKLWFALELVESSYELQGVGSDTVWRRVETLHAVWNGPGETVDEYVRAAIPCPAAGRYRLTIRMQSEDGIEVSEVSTEFYATDGDPARFEAPSEDSELVVLSASANRADPGGSLTVQMRAPLDGVALITLEGARLRWHTQVQVVDGHAEVELPIPADVRGGVTITCQVTRPLDAMQATWMPHRAYGFLHVETAHVSSHLALDIVAPERVRPGERVEVLVEADVTSATSANSARRAMVHLWAVDEGIRLAGGHRLPEPREHFLGTRAYGGATTDAWFDLLPDLDLAGAVSRIGGDQAGARAARRRAPERVHSLPGIVWLEAVELDENGRATFQVETPDFTGELTWMAVVVDGDRYGSAQAKTRLAGELPMLVSRPRFVAPGDTFEVQLRFENQTTETATVVPRLKLEGPVRERMDVSAGSAPIEASFSKAHSFEARAVTLAPGEAATHLFHLEATGSGRLTGMALLEGTFESGRAALERTAIDLPVRSGRPLVVASMTRCFGAADADAQSLDLAELLGLESGAELTHGTLSTSAHFGVSLEPAGSYLSAYPHGCAEQTASRIWALLALPELVAPGDDPDLAAREVARRVSAGLARLEAMQLPSGGIGYWSSNSQASPWASAYVAELLHSARALGHDVPSSMTDGLVRYLREELELNGRAQERAALVHGIALLGQPMPGWVRRLAEQAQLLGPGGRAQIASAFAMEGEHERALELILDDRLEPESNVPSRFSRLISPTRTAALQLRVLLEVSPDHDRVLELVGALENARQAGGGRWNNTIDNAAALVALAQFHQALAEVPSDWSVNVVTGAGRSFESNSSRAATFELGTEDANLELQVDGDGPLFVSARFEGRVQADAPARDAGLRVRRRLLDRAGKEVDLQSVAVGDLVFAEVSLLSECGLSVSDVAIVDPLPGGFEVENPRLSQASLKLTGDARKAGSADRVEFLDDRVLIFATATEEARFFRYGLRAVAPGDFEQGPVQAEAMYAPEVCSVGSETTRVRVSR